MLDGRGAFLPFLLGRGGFWPRPGWVPAVGLWPGAGATSLLTLRVRRLVVLWPTATPAAVLKLDRTQSTTAWPVALTRS